MKTNIEVAKLWKDRGTSISLSNEEGDSIVLFESRDMPRTACLKAADILIGLAGRLTELAGTSNPYNAHTQEMINAGK